MLFAALAAGRAEAAPGEHWYPAVPERRSHGLTVLVLTEEDAHWIRRLDLLMLGIVPPRGATRTHQGELFLPLSEVPGLVLDEAKGTVTVAEPASTASTADTAPEPLIVDIFLDGQKLSAPRVVQRAGDTLLLDRETTQALRLRVPEGGQGQDPEWIALAAPYRLDAEAGVLHIDATPAQLQRTHLLAYGAATPVPATARATPLVATISYDLNSTRVSGGQDYATGWLDAGLAWGRIQCTSSHFASSGERPLRIASYCGVDWPDRPASLTLGDAFSAGGALTAPVRFAGLHVGTNRALQPGVPTYPLLSVQGSVDDAARLDVWVRQHLALQTQLPAGEYLVDGLNPVAGRGLIRTLITAADGVQQAFNTPFYFDPALLRPGLDEWSLDAGLLRQDFGAEDDRYETPFAKTEWRTGVTNGFTFGLDGEVSAEHALLGASGRMKVGNIGIVELAAARSQADGAGGWAGSVAYTYRASRWNFGARYAERQPSFTSLAYLQDDLGRISPRLRPPRDEMQVQSGVRFGRLSASAGVLSRTEYDNARSHHATAAVNVAFRRSFLGLTAFKDIDGDDSTVVVLTYSVPLSPLDTLSAWASPSSQQGGVTFQRNPGGGLGYDYQVGYQQLRGEDQLSFGAEYRAMPVRLSTRGLYSGSGWIASLGAGGALIATSDGVFLSSDSSDSYALVRLPDPGVRIYRDHQLAAITNEAGVALVPGLRPYQRNRLDLDADDLALTTALGKQWEELVPNRGELMRVDFGAHREQFQSFRLVRGDGTVVPLGAVAVISPGNTSTVVGHDGMVALEGGAAAERIEARWRDGACSAVAATASAEVSLQTLKCEAHDAQ